MILSRISFSLCVRDPEIRDYVRPTRPASQQSRKTVYQHKLEWNVLNVFQNRKPVQVIIHTSIQIL